MNIKILLFLLLPLSTHCQTISLRLTSNGAAVSGATVYDSLQDRVRITNEDGYLVLPGSNYYLKITHVSYQSAWIKITRPLHDTTINIFLKNNNILINPLVIEASKKKKIICEVGNGFQNTLSTYTGLDRKSVV